MVQELKVDCNIFWRHSNKLYSLLVKGSSRKYFFKIKVVEKKESRDTSSLGQSTWSKSCFPVVLELKENSSSASKEVTRTLTCNSGDNNN